MGISAEDLVIKSTDGVEEWEKKQTEATLLMYRAYLPVIAHLAAHRHQASCTFSMLYQGHLARPPAGV